MSDPMNQRKEQTYFARPERLGYRELASQMLRSLEDPVVKVVLEAVDGYVMILNEQRQILAANQTLLDGFERHDPNFLIGLRAGEAFNCVHFTEGPGGCGTSEHCRTCGAVVATLAAQVDGKQATEECRLTLLRDGNLEARDFRVRCTPLDVGGARLIAFVLHDISSEKRREVLEATFLHDMLNSIGGIEGWSSLIHELDQDGAAREILSLATSLKDGIVSHRTLLDAEKGILAVHATMCDVAEVLSRLQALFESHPVASGKRFEIVPAPEGAQVRCDKSILLRVLINMVKNAFEAVEIGDVVRVWFDRENGSSRFSVHNPGVMSSDTKLHIFERSFSTKAEHGRGIGTFSMKLFGERYLGGTVSFSSDNGGIVFSISLPQGIGIKQPESPIAITSSGKQNTRRVLFVEDDESLRRLGQLFLHSFGCKVTACADGNQALSQFQASPANFDLCLTDKCMPGMDGLELCRQLVAIRPDMPVILVTGSDEQMDDVQYSGISSVLHKPFDLHELDSVLQRVFAP